ncbi:hypothetical protein CYMTET_18326 [Cymbomonas tetramitiformis]|uniref:Mutator-like transposase domain-containing protein n=1 Tax=Cymbomonas tetramitiformis TaxID=36881 RepID=A0AAE0G8M8_9CHLO|nr:hypothetical protein CYMTET_18326 [Cymbomonas tetramitiformis]
MLRNVHGVQARTPTAAAPTREMPTPRQLNNDFGDAITTTIENVESGSGTPLGSVSPTLNARLGGERSRPTPQNAGLAPAKVEKLFTSLGVDYTLHKTAHGNIQKRVGSVVEVMAKESCERAFENEIISTMQNEAKIEKSDGKSIVLLSATGDCAWPTRGSGHSYASICGGFILMGAIHKKIMSAAIFSKMCIVCEKAEKEATQQNKGPDIPVHDCFRGCRGIMADSDHLWRGSSKAMEPKGALCTALGLGNYCLKRDILKAIIARIRYFTADEDSNMIAALNSDLLPAWLRPVDKLSDPNHMQKIQYKVLEALRVNEKWKGGTLSKAVIDYLNRMYRYIIKSVAAKEDLEWAFPDEEKVEWLSGAVMNVVDHAFGKHENCGKYRVPLPDGTWHSWCGVDANDPDYKPHLPHGKFLNPNEPPGYYEKVKEVFLSRLAKKEVLLKQLHDTDTNATESYHSMLTRGFLPGGKAQQNGQSGVYFWAHCHAICSKNDGTAYRRDLCARLGIDPPDSMYDLDERLQRRREKNAAFRRTHDAKKKRRLDRDHRGDRNVEARFDYATGVGFDHDSRGQVLDHSSGA